MILVNVVEESGEKVCWELPIKYAKSEQHLMKRIKKMLDEEYGKKPYKMTDLLTPLG